MIDAAFDRVSRRYRIRRPANVSFLKRVFHALLRTTDVAWKAGRAFAVESRLWCFSGFMREGCVCLARR